MTNESLLPDHLPIIATDLGENGGRIELATIPDARRWVKQEIEAWRNFGGNMGSLPLRGKVLDRQLAVPSEIAEHLAQAISLEGVELLQTMKNIQSLFEKYADYHSLNSESGLGMAILNTRTARSQRAALGGLACSIGIPAYEVLHMAGPDDNGIVDVVAGYAMGRELNVVKRSEIGRHEERMENYIERFRTIVVDANANNEATKKESEKRLAEMAQEANRQKTMSKEFSESAKDQWEKLKTTFDMQLRLEAPASYWGKEAKRTYKAAILSLLLFAVIALAIIGTLVGHGPSFLKELANITGGGGYASVALISIPALTALWILRHFARLFVTNFERSNDAKNAGDDGNDISRTDERGGFPLPKRKSVF